MRHSHKVRFMATEAWNDPNPQDMPQVHGLKFYADKWVLELLTAQHNYDREISTRFYVCGWIDEIWWFF